MNTHRHLYILFIVFALIICQSISYAGSKNDPNKIVSANEFRLVDKNGNIRAALMFEDNNPVLTFVDLDGKPLAYMALVGQYPLFVMKDKNLTPRLMISLDTQGFPGIYLLKNRNKPILALQLGKDNQPTLIMRGENDQPALLAGVLNGSASIGFLKGPRDLGLALGLNKHGEPTMFFRDSSGNIDFSLARVQGQPQMYFGGRSDGLYLGTPSGIPYVGVKHGGEMVWSAYPPGLAVPEIPEPRFNLDDMTRILHP